MTSVNFKTLTVTVVVAALCSGSIASAQTGLGSGQPPAGAKLSVASVPISAASRRKNPSYFSALTTRMRRGMPIL